MSFDRLKALLNNSKQGLRSFFVNLILLNTEEEGPTLHLRHTDPRALHIKTVLKLKPGSTCFIGLPQGKTGQATLEHADKEGVTLSIRWQDVAPAPLFPVHLILGLPRPQTARKVLQASASMGVEGLCFFCSDKGEPGYAQSTLWSSPEWETHLKTGAEQAFATTYPSVEHCTSLEASLTSIAPLATRIALDVYESPLSLNSALHAAKPPFVLAIGSERGWSAKERELLRAHGFSFAHLGPRVLRTETACVAALGALLSRFAW